MAKFKIPSADDYPNETFDYALAHAHTDCFVGFTQALITLDLVLAHINDGELERAALKGLIEEFLNKYKQ